LEQLALPQRICFERRERNEFLTDAFHHPERLRSAKGFASLHLASCIDGGLPQPSQQKQGLFVEREPDKRLGLIWFICALLLSMVTGIGAGVARRDLGIGLAIGTAVLSVLSAVQALLAWLVK